MQIFNCKNANNCFIDFFFQAGHQVQDCVASWFSLYPQPKLVLTLSRAQVYSMRAEPPGGRVREAVALLDSPAFTALSYEVNQIGSKGTSIKDARSSTYLLDCKFFRGEKWKKTQKTCFFRVVWQVFLWINESTVRLTCGFLLPRWHLSYSVQWNLVSPLPILRPSCSHTCKICAEKVLSRFYLWLR